MRPRALLTASFLSLCFALAVAILAETPGLKKQDKLFFQVTLTSSEGGLAQLFFDVGRGFVETDSALKVLNPNQPVEHRFELPSKKIFGLRFDPINTQADVTIAAPVIVDRRGNLVYHFSPDAFNPAQHIKSLIRSDDSLRMICAQGGQDPFIIITVPPNLGPKFIFKEWLSAVTVITTGLFLLVIGLCFAVSSFGEFFSRPATFLRGRPLLTLGALSALGALSQFHPLFFPPQVSNFASELSAHDSTSSINLTTYNLGNDKLSLSSSVLSWANIFSSLPKLAGGGRWTIAAGILTEWWVYLFGCALLVWLITDSLGTATLIAGCSLFTRVWSSGVLPLSIPALAAAPWTLMAWGLLAKVPLPSKTFFLVGAAIFVANIEMVAAECSLRVATLATSLTAAGVLYILLQPQPWTSRLIRAGLGLGLFILFGVVVALVFWRSILIPGNGSPEAATAFFQTVPASAGVSFFESFFWRSPGAYPLSSANVVILAGLAWAFARSNETFQKPEFIALAIAMVLLAPLAFGIFSDRILIVWFKKATTARLQEAAWYTLVFFSAILGSFGFVGLRRLCTKPDSIYRIAKATLLFLLPFIMYFGHYQDHGAYSLKLSYLISILSGWSIAHLAFTHFQTSSEIRVSWIFVACALIIAWWHHAPYVHLFLQDALLKS